MRVQYDMASDAAMIYLTEEKRESVRQEVVDLELQDSAMVLDIDASDRLIAIEILGASKVLPPELTVR